MFCMRPIPGLVHADAALAPFLAANAHAFTRADLLDRWSRRELENALHDGHAVRVLPAVYAAPAHGSLPHVRGEALNLWHPPGLVTGALALHLFAKTLPVPKVADLRVTNGKRPRAPQWVRCRQGDPVHTSSFANGVACTVPARALLDAWRYAPPRERRNVLWEALWSRVCTWRQLARELERAPRVGGRRDLERVLGWFEGGATTPLEVMAQYETFADARFREFERQVQLSLPTRNATPDMLHRRTMVAVELDGDKYHSTREARDADRQRRTELAAAGYTVIGFGWRDVFDRPQWCRERLLQAVAARERLLR